MHNNTEKVAVVLFNLGGPDNLQSVKPFLKNLFNDKAIIPLPFPLRWFIAKLISSRREKEAQEIYEKIGGKSPLLENTMAQSKALEKILNEGKNTDKNYKVFISMRYWKPFAKTVFEDVIKYSPHKVILLPLYPQFSTTTTASSLKEWEQLSNKKGIKFFTQFTCCYPTNNGFIHANARLLENALAKIKDITNFRILFSAHGLPQKIVDKGDPYAYQVNITAEEIINRLKSKKDLDWRVTFQSRVGPVEWIKPYTDNEIIDAGKEGKSLIVVPLSFVSEHSETLVELDIEYKDLANESGVKEYIRIPTVSIENEFISGLKDLVKDIEANDNHYMSEFNACPDKYNQCCLKQITKG